MLNKALSYCLQEETHISFADIISVPPQEMKQTKFLAKPMKMDFKQFQTNTQQSTKCGMTKMSSTELRNRIKMKKDLSPYISPYVSDIEKNFQLQNTHCNNSSFNNSKQFNTIETRRRTYSIQMNQQNLKLRFRDMSMFTDRKFSFVANQF